MGAESYANYYPLPPKPCDECEEMLPAGTAHIHYSLWEWYRDELRFWLRRLFRREA